MWLAATGGAAAQELRVSTYYAPTTDLERIELSVLNRVAPGSTVNFAGFVLSDFKVIAALGRIGAAGGRVRVYLDPRELKRSQPGPNHPLTRLAATPNVEVRVKASAASLMHLKGYTIDGLMLRTGSANASRDGLRAQDNDLVLIHSREAAGRFDAVFDQMWDRPDNTRLVP
jgi:phosphatidylserine/phosphatidylglycerophosphate/cardiolipin synthase-like enzyme